MIALLIISFKSFDDSLDNIYETNKFIGNIGEGIFNSAK